MEQKLKLFLSSLDVIKVNHARTNSYVRKRIYKTPFFFKTRICLRYSKEFIKKLFASIFAYFTGRKTSPQKQYFLSFTKNQKTSCERNIEYFSPNSFIGNYSFGRSVLPEYKAFIYSLKYLRIVTKQIQNLEINPKFFWEFYLIPGYIIMAYNFLSRRNVKGIVTSNDHNYQNRCFIFACQLLDIPSVYIQHASVSEFFPKLETTFALLEGEDAADKYLSIGHSETTILVVGKASGNYKKNTSDKISALGYSFNDLDNANDVMETIETVLSTTQKLHVRPHPHEPRKKLLNKIGSMNGVILSDSRNENVESFLENIDLLITGDSNVQLDAISMNIEVIYHSTSKEHSDYYGFVKNKMVKYTSQTTEELEKLISEIRTKDKNVYLRSKYFDSSINSIMENRGEEFYASLIGQIFDGKLDLSLHFDKKRIRGKDIYIVKQKSNN